MITVNSHPNYISLVGNPLRFSISSDNQFSTQGVAASFDLVIHSVDLTAGHTFSLSFNNKTLAFVLATTPDDSGLQLPVGEAGDTFSDWAENLYSHFILNFDLVSNYIISLNSSQGSSRSITFTAMVKGTDWSVVFVNGVGGSNLVNGLLVENNVSGVDAVSRENFSIVASVWNEFFDKLGEDIQPVDEIGNVIFDLSEYIRHEILRDPLVGEREKTFFAWPPNDDDIIICRGDYILKYRASFAEKYSGSVCKTHFEPERLAIAGGVSRELQQDYLLQSTDYFSIEANLKRFLTWAPDGKLCSASTPEKLFFLLFGENPPFTYLLSVKITYTDGTNYSFSATTVVTLEDETVLECMVGHDHLGLGEKQPTKTIDYWEVWLINQQGESISEIRRFVLDKLYREFERTFLFKNSLSAYDVVRFVGKAEYSLEYERIRATIETTDAPTHKNAPEKLFEVTEWQRMTVNSGFISKETKDYLRDLESSTEVYEIIDNKLYPVIISNAKFNPFFKDKETLYSLSLEYDRAYQEKFYGHSVTVNVPGGTRLTADNTLVTADNTVIKADQTIY